MTTTPPTSGAFTRKAPSVLLMGGLGTGKTTSLKTLAELCDQVFIIATEYPDVLEDTDSAKVHWHYIPPVDVGWDVLLKTAQMTNQFTPDMLQKNVDSNRSKYTGFLDVVRCSADFTCERCGKSFGPVDKLPNTSAVVVDGLSGLSIQAKFHTVGAKVPMTQPEWGVAMDQIEMLVNKWVFSCDALFVLTAHIERETDEVTNASHIMVSTLGRRLAPKIPRYFSDVVHATRVGKEFKWTTTTANMELKSRNLPIGETYSPDFRELHKRWLARQPK